MNSTTPKFHITTTQSGATIAIGRSGWYTISGTPINDEAWAAFDAHWAK